MADPAVPEEVPVVEGEASSDSPPGDGRVRSAGSRSGSKRRSEGRADGDGSDADSLSSLSLSDDGRPAPVMPVATDQDARIAVAEQAAGEDGSETLGGQVRGRIRGTIVLSAPDPVSLGLPAPTPTIADLDIRETSFPSLLCGRNATLARLIVKNVPAHAADVVARSLMCVFSAAERLEDLVALCVDVEVGGTTHKETLFRGTSIPTKVISLYIKFVGTQFLREMLGPVVVSTVSKRDVSLEVSPTRIAPGESVEENMAKLIATCEVFFIVMTSSPQSVPAEIRWVIRTIRQRARARFGTDDVAGARAFLFLRYFCAAVVAPESFDLIDSPPTSVARRALVLVSKVLQNLANGVRFNNRNEDMKGCNLFIISHYDDFVEYFNEISGGGGEAEPSTAAAVGEVDDDVPSFSTRPYQPDRQKEAFECLLGTAKIYRHQLGEDIPHGVDEDDMTSALAAFDNILSSEIVSTLTAFPAQAGDEIDDLHAELKRRAVVMEIENMSRSAAAAAAASGKDGGTGKDKKKSKGKFLSIKRKKRTDKTHPLLASASGGADAAGPSSAAGTGGVAPNRFLAPSASEVNVATATDFGALVVAQPPALIFLLASLRRRKVPLPHVASAVLHYAHSRGVVTVVVDAAVMFEIRTKTPDNLFASTNVATEMIAQYFRLARSPAPMALAPVLQTLMEQDTSWELGDAVPEGETAEGNAALLVSMAERVLRVVLDVDDIGRPILALLSSMHAQAVSTFSRMGGAHAASVPLVPAAVGAFFVKEYWCRVVENPVSYSAIQRDPPARARRALGLLSRVISHLASGEAFAAADELAPLNPLLNSLLGVVRSMYDTLTHPTADRVAVMPSPSAAIEREALEVILSFVEIHHEPLLATELSPALYGGNINDAHAASDAVFAEVNEVLTKVHSTRNELSSSVVFGFVVEVSEGAAGGDRLSSGYGGGSGAGTLPRPKRESQELTPSRGSYGSLGPTTASRGSSHRRSLSEVFTKSKGNKQRRSYGQSTSGRSSRTPSMDASDASEPFRAGALSKSSSQTLRMALDEMTAAGEDEAAALSREELAAAKRRAMDLQNENDRLRNQLAIYGIDEDGNLLPSPRDAAAATGDNKSSGSGGGGRFKFFKRRRGTTAAASGGSGGSDSGSRKGSGATESMLAIRSAMAQDVAAAARFRALEMELEDERAERHQAEVAVAELRQMVLGLEKRTALLDAALLRADDLEEQLSVHQRPVFTTRDDGDGPLSDDTSEGSASFHDDTATGSDAAASDVGDEPYRSDGDSERPSAPGSGDLGVAPDGSEEAAPVVAVVNEDGSTATGEVESLRAELVKAKADLEAAEQTTASLRGVLERHSGSANGDADRRRADKLKKDLAEVMAQRDGAEAAHAKATETVGALQARVAELEALAAAAAADGDDGSTGRDAEVAAANAFAEAAQTSLAEAEDRIIELETEVAAAVGRAEGAAADLAAVKAEAKASADASKARIAALEAEVEEARNQAAAVAVVQTAEPCAKCRDGAEVERLEAEIAMVREELEIARNLAQVVPAEVAGSPTNLSLGSPTRGMLERPRSGSMSPMSAPIAIGNHRRGLYRDNSDPRGLLRTPKGPAMERRKSTSNLRDRIRMFEVLSSPT